MKVLIVDDDPVVRSAAGVALRAEGFETLDFADADRALREVDFDQIEAVVSDLYMPNLDGGRFLQLLSERGFDRPFLVITTGDDIRVAVELMRAGAADFVRKPLNPTEFGMRVRRAIAAHQRERRLRIIEDERRLLEIENRALVSWKALYGTKDARQAEQLMELLARRIQQAGGYLWLDILQAERGTAEPTTDGNVRYPAELIDVALNSAQEQRTAFEQLEFVGTLASRELDIRSMAVSALHDRLNSYLTATLDPLVRAHGRSVRKVASNAAPSTATVRLDWDVFGGVLFELVVNAIKFSPPETVIVMEWGPAETPAGAVWQLLVRNRSKDAVSRGMNDEVVHGIPIEYSELVFDLFYTVERFPTSIPEQRWHDGIGLYAARRLLQRHGGWIAAANVMDYTGGLGESSTELRIQLPIETS